MSARWLGGLLVCGACVSKKAEPAPPVVVPVASVGAVPASRTPATSATSNARRNADDRTVAAVKNDLRALHAAAEKWRVEHALGECPSVETLARDKEISASSKLGDPWGGPYLVYCTEDDTRVVSRGPDGSADTADDIVVP